MRDPSRYQRQRFFEGKGPSHKEPATDNDGQVRTKRVNPQDVWIIKALEQHRAIALQVGTVEAGKTIRRRLGRSLEALTFRDRVVIAYAEGILYIWINALYGYKRALCSEIRELCHKNLYNIKDSIPGLGVADEEEPAPIASMVKVLIGGEEREVPPHIAEWIQKRQQEQEQEKGG